jgi:hypothetical protein
MPKILAKKNPLDSFPHGYYIIVACRELAACTSTESTVKSELQEISYVIPL